MTMAVDTGLRILTKVDGQLSPGVMDAIEPYEGDEAYYPDYVDVELPRDDYATEEIVEAGTGRYAIWSEDEQKVIARFEGEKNGMTALQRAFQARAGAKVVLDFSIEGLDDAEAAEAETVSEATPTSDDDETIDDAVLQAAIERGAGQEAE